MRTDEELKQIAIDYNAGLIFTDQQVRNPNDLGMVFMPLVMMTREERQQELADAYRIFEYRSAAGPRAINGMPMFMSFRTATKAECEKIDAYSKMLLDAQKSVTLPKEWK